MKILIILTTTFIPRTNTNNSIDDYFLYYANGVQLAMVF
jgi:hypothetical protein